jgi:hypothetical protein
MWRKGQWKNERRAMNGKREGDNSEGVIIQLTVTHLITIALILIVTIIALLLMMAPPRQDILKEVILGLAWCFGCILRYRGGASDLVWRTPDLENCRWGFLYCRYRVISLQPAAALDFREVVGLGPQAKEELLSLAFFIGATASLTGLIRLMTWVYCLLIVLVKPSRSGSWIRSVQW